MNSVLPLLQYKQSLTQPQSVTTATALSQPLSYSDCGQLGDCAHTWCNSHSYFPVIVPCWKLEYYACTVSHMQHAKFHRTERPPFMDSRQRITSYAQRRVMLYLLWFSFLHITFCSWTSLWSISIITDAECRHYTVIQVFVLPWHLVLFPHLFECDRKNLQNLLKFPCGSTWPALIGMVSSAAAKEL